MTAVEYCKYASIVGDEPDSLRIDCKNSTFTGAVPLLINI